MKRPTAFTLIELLVVIAIIVALLAILLPSMGKAKAVAQRAVCGSQTRQLVTACFTYGVGNRGQLPPEVRDLGNIAGKNHVFDQFRGDMYKNLGLPDEIWTCPATDWGAYDIGSVDTRGSMYGWDFGVAWPNSMDLPNKRVGYIYAANTYNVISPASVVIDTDRMPRSLNATSRRYAPAAQTLFADQIKYFATTNTWEINHPASKPGAGSAVVGQSSTDGGNQAFLDGHTEWVATYPDPLIVNGGTPNWFAKHDAGGTYGHWWW